MYTPVLKKLTGSTGWPTQAVVETTVAEAIQAKGLPYIIGADWQATPEEWNQNPAFMMPPGMEK